MLLDNRYRIIKTLGSGGFGETYLAEDTQMPSQRRCVIKQLKPIQNNTQIYQLVQERFQREAAILEELGSTSNQIPSLYAYFQFNDQFYLVQELIAGDTVTEKIQQHGILTENAVREILLSLLPVLEYVHSKRIIHRDIKPDNIILRHHDGKPVLIDFGAVRELMGTVVNSQGNPTSSIVIGTPGFMPSEQASGRPVYSSDLYSLGLTAIYLLTGKIPQDLPTEPTMGNILWRHFAPHLNINFGDVLDKAISYHPKERFSSAREMLTALQTLSNPVAPAFVPTPTVIAAPSPLSPENTIAVSPGNDVQNSHQTNQNTARGGIILASVIASGLIGASIIVGFAINKSPLPIESSNNKNTSVSSSASQENQKTLLSNSYCVLASKDANTSPNRVFFKEISNVSISNTSPINTTNANTNNYFWISLRRVTEADLVGKDGYELDIMRNTVFAVNGRRFDTPGLQEYFNQQSWYNPRYSPKQFPVSLLSKLEQQNVEYIAKYQDQNNLRHFKK
ncbi:MAG: YARHG domain-containing protein [Aphanizomenon gracile PMC649.10]|jgi:serine/threonine protein kinase, bacterial|nr:YARHG domain-containing protein [Aphanizomenon gracile PMC649.10]